MKRNTAWIVVGVLVLGTTLLAATKPAPLAAMPEIRTVADVLKSLKGELIRLSEQFPELVDAKAIRIDDHAMELEYLHNCKDSGKRGYEETGPNACAIALRVMSTEQFRKDVKEKEMQAPNHQWGNLRSVGWVSSFSGKAPSPGFQAKVDAVLGKHVAMLDALDRRAAEGQDKQEARNTSARPRESGQ